jgi:hypothetical protein
MSVKGIDGNMLEYRCPNCEKVITLEIDSGDEDKKLSTYIGDTGQLFVQLPRCSCGSTTFMYLAHDDTDAGHIRRIVAHKVASLSHGIKNGTNKADVDAKLAAMEAVYHGNQDRLREFKGEKAAKVRKGQSGGVVKVEDRKMK